MHKITAATANIYWYGLRESSVQAHGPDVRFFHNAADDARLATLLQRIGADLFCFEEIVDLARFEGVLAKANPALRVRDQAARMVCSLPSAVTPDTQQRVVLAWNTERLTLIDWQRLPFWTRSPVVAAFEHKPTGQRFDVIGVHAKSSEPEASNPAGQKKRNELAMLADWVTQQSQAGKFANALILGDLNSTSRGEDAKYLRRGVLTGWHWREATGEADSLWTTTTDGVVIDHVLVSAALSTHVDRWPEIVYFDRDPAVADAPDPGVVPRILKRLTDHRPVRMSFNLN